MSQHSPNRARRLLGAAATVLLTAALAPAPAGAAEPPITTVDTFDRINAYECPQGFAVTERYTGTETIRRFADGRQLTHVRVRSEFTNTATGQALRAVTPFLITFEIGEWVSFVGVTFRLSAPGEGALTVDAGRLVFDWHTGDVIFERGPSQLRTNLCAYWGG